MEKVFENQYGRATLTTITDFMPVKKIKGVNYSNDIKFDIDAAAHLALITSNRGIQIAYEVTKKTFYVVLHDSPSTCAVCKVSFERVFDGDPHEEIDRLLPHYPSCFSV